MPDMTPICINKNTVAELFQTTPRSIDMKVAAGEFPEPVRIGKTAAPRWRVKELDAWVDSGCPEIDSWDWPLISNTPEQTPNAN